MTSSDQDLMIPMISDRLRILGQPVRIRLIQALRVRPGTVQELTLAVDGVQQNVSQHLGLLHRAGILSRRKDGTRVWYELTDMHALRIVDEARDSLRDQFSHLARLVADEP